VDAIDDRWRGGDQVEVVFAAQPLLNDLEVQQAEEAAAEAEAQRGGAFGLEGEARIVEAQARDALAQLRGRVPPPRSGGRSVTGRRPARC